MDKMFKGLCFGLLLIAGSSNAALLSYNGYTLNEDSNIVTGDSLEWLQWDVTFGMSIETALSEVSNTYAGGGWELASNIQMAKLFNAFGFSSLVEWDSDENTTQTTKNIDDEIELISDPERNFVRMFGHTFADSSDPQLSSDPFKGSAALFGLDLDGDGLYNRAIAYDDYISGNSGVYSSGEVRLLNDTFTKTYEPFATGVALVRVSNNVEVEDVPEPSSSIIFCLALFGMIALRKSDN